MHGATPPLHNTCSRRNAELRTERNLLQCSDWIANCAENRSVDRVSILVLYFVESQGYAIQNSF